MKNFCITILVFPLITIELSAQVKMEISDVIVYDIKVILYEGEFIEGELVSPSIKGKLCITNDSEKSVMFERDKFMLLLNYKCMPYQQEVSVMNINKAIMPCDTIFLDFKCDLVRYTSIQKRQEDEIPQKDYIIDYTMELIEILPTIRIRYRDSLHEYWAVGIENVSIVKKDYY